LPVDRKRGLSLISRGYTALLYGMAWLAGFLIAAMMLVITVDVVVRNLGYQSSAHFFTFTEYSLLIVPCLGAPWLVREKGHIYVEILLMNLSPPARRRLMAAIGLACIAVCLVIAWYGLQVTLTDFRQAERDVRSFDAPRWLVIGWIPLAFLLMAVEFARFLWRREDFLMPMSELSQNT
jgi:C4-dicarboxylate transporter DctQ subunit